MFSSHRDQLKKLKNNAGGEGNRSQRPTDERGGRRAGADLRAEPVAPSLSSVALQAAPTFGGFGGRGEALLSLSLVAMGVLYFPPFPGMGVV